MKQTFDEIMEMASEANGRRRNRTIGKYEANLILQMVENASDDAKIIRVYSRQGFVANSYKYRCDISYFEATRQENGDWMILAHAGRAQRSHGSGALVTINGRAA